MKLKSAILALALAGTATMASAVQTVALGAGTSSGPGSYSFSAFNYYDASSLGSIEITFDPVDTPSGLYNVSIDLGYLAFLMEVPTAYLDVNNNAANQIALNLAGVTPFPSFTGSFSSQISDAAHKIYFNFAGEGVLSANIDITAVPAPVPEPETYAMLLAGLGAVGLMSRRRKASAAIASTAA